MRTPRSSSASLRFKLIAPLGASILIGLCFAGVFVAQELQSSRKLRSSVQHMEVMRAASALVHQMQLERGMTSLYSSGALSEPELTAQRKETDKAQAVLQGALKNSGLMESAIEEIESDMSSLEDLRGRVAPGSDAALLRSLYTMSITHLLAIQPEVAKLEAGTGAGASISALILLEQTKEAAGQLRARVSTIAAQDKSVSLSEASGILELSAKLTANLDSPGIALSQGLDTLKTLRDSPARRMAEGNARNIFARYTQGHYGIDSADFFEKMTSFIDSAYKLISNETDLHLAELNKNEFRTRIFFWISTVFIILGYLAVTVLSLRVVLRVVSSARAVANSLKEVSEGGGDLTRQLPVLSSDELGELARHFNGFQSELASLVREVKETSEALTQVGSELSSTMTQTASAAVQISANVESVKRRTVDQSAGATESSATVERIAQNLATLNEAIARQTSSVTNSSASIEEMVANVRSVTRNVERMGEEYLKLIDSAGAGREVLNQTVAEVKRISERSERLRDANALISSIAAQTNLLAMNAAIEAAHAGGAGLGFAVVADEIRKLAENSAKQSKAIAVDVREISGAINDVVASSDAAAASFGDVVAQIEQLHSLEEEIKLAMTEQSAGSSQVLESLNLINGVTAEVTRGAHEMKDGSDAVLGEMRRLLDASVEIEHSMTEIALGAAEVSQASTAAADLTVKNRDGIEAVGQAMGRFKV